ncbi:MAG: hypothetical protein J6Y69_03120 [Treponema sp.]|nr:hypothetical protein [Treponema sp.]
MEKFCVKGIYASGMVLQRNRINCISGFAPGQSSVSVFFREQEWTCTSDEDGCWKIEFNPGEAGGPFALEVKNGSETISYSDVWVGEVWLLSGQSNAQLPMERLKWSYPEDFKLPKNDNIRMITVPISFSFDGEKDFIDSPKWIPASPETLGLMSGTGYFFAKNLSRALNVPVGIVNASQGGSPIISWMDRQSVADYRGKQNYLETLEKCEKPDNLTLARKATDEAIKKWTDELFAGVDMPDLNASDWKECSIPGEIDEPKGAGLLWLKKEIELSETEAQTFNSRKTRLWLGRILDADFVYVNGVQVGATYYCYPPRRYEVPSGTLHAGKNYILIKIQKNSSAQKISFTAEKPYYLFTENVYVPPVAFRNTEKCRALDVPEGELCIPLSGTWEMKIAKEMSDRPSELFFEWAPTALYNSMLSPCFDQAISGALWYQGESDAGNADEYEELLEKMIMLWRRKFVYGAKDFPFIIVQLPNFSDGRYESNTIDETHWVDMRKVQSRVSRKVKNCGLAVMIDAGEWNDLHPEKKSTVGQRLSYEALRLAYGLKDIPSSPRPSGCHLEGNDYAVDFDLHDGNLCSVVNKDDELKGFYLLAEGNKVEVAARLKDSKSLCIPVPEKLRGKVDCICYLQADCPKDVDLYVKADCGACVGSVMIPVVPFELCVHGSC